MAETATVVLEKTNIKTTLRKKVKVVMHNDDTTSFDCVIEILTSVFNKTEQDAFSIAMAIHKTGKKVVGEYSKTIAEAKRDKALNMAKAQGYPEFKVTVED